MARKPKTLEEKVIESKKRIGISKAEVFRILSVQGKIFQSVKLKGVRASIRLIISMKNADFTCWAMALLVNEVRVAGVDWEGRVHDHRGHKCSGWHKHVWKPEALRSLQKECLDKFDPKNGWEFVRLGLEVLRFDLDGTPKKGDEDANGNLFIN